MFDYFVGLARKGLSFKTGYFQLSIATFSATGGAFHSTLCTDGIVRTYAMSDKLKKNTFVLNCQNINKAIATQLTFTL